MNEDTTDNESIISNMGYIDSANSNNSLSESSSNGSSSNGSSSNDSSSNDSQIIALTTLSDSDYDDDDDDESNDIPYINYEFYDDYENRQVQAIYQDDKYHLDADKNDSCYYVGIYKHYSSSGKFLLINSVSGSTFTKYSYDDIIEYLNCYSIALRWYSEIGIVQMHISNQVYYVVLKTYWLRLIQRVWKKKYQIYKENQQKKLLPQNTRYREIHGKFNNKLNYLPKIYGMLSEYNNKLT